MKNLQQNQQKNEARLHLRLWHSANGETPARAGHTAKNAARHEVRAEEKKEYAWRRSLQDTGRAAVTSWLTIRRPGRELMDGGRRAPRGTVGGRSADTILEVKSIRRITDRQSSISMGSSASRATNPNPNSVTSL